MIEQYCEWRRNSDKKRHGEGKVRAVTVNRELAALKHFGRKCEDWNYVASNPTRKVKLLPNDGVIHGRFLSTKEYAVMVWKATEMDREALPEAGSLIEPFENLTEFVVVDVNTGLRWNEIRNLEFTDIGWDRRMLCVRVKPHLEFAPKNREERHVPLTDQAYIALRSMLSRKHPQSEFVFHKKDGGRWTDIRGSFNALVERCELKADPPHNITIHSLRHTFGAWLASAGVPLRSIQKLMGHKSITVTERFYAHLAPESYAAAIRALGSFVTNSVPNGIKPGREVPVLTAVTHREDWCGGWESNPHGPCGPRDFKSLASTSSATPAR